MTQAQITPALSAIETQALSIAAHVRLALSGKPSDALSAYFELKQAAELSDKARTERMHAFPSAGHSEEDDEVFVVDMLDAIEKTAKVMTRFGRLMLKAAHAGLVDAAIDGTLDSDANEWHLPSFAETNLDKVAL
jgi:hypothetical protein